MGRHRVNPRLIKIHRSYTVDEAARTLGTHKNTIRAWIKQGLPTIDRGRPTLIYGADLRHFLETRRKRAKQPCPPGHLFCVRCRIPKLPAGEMAEYIPITATSGNLRGICPNCEALIHRRVSLSRLDAVRADLDVTFPQAPLRIRDTTVASQNCDSKRDGKTHENA